MALIMEQKQVRGVNWFAVFVFIFLLAVIAGGGYFLFFAPTPYIDTIVPSSLDMTDRLSQAQFDLSNIINNPTLKTLHEYGTVPAVGSLGKQNPFLP